LRAAVHPRFVPDGDAQQLTLSPFTSPKRQRGEFPRWRFGLVSRNTPMIIVLKPHATDEQLTHVLERIQELGFKPHLSKGEHRTIIGVIGDENKLRAEPLQAIPGVEQVLPILKPFKLASREFHRADTVIAVGKVKVGGGHLAMIAGPCAVESLAVLDEIAGQVKAAARTSCAAARSSRVPVRTASRASARRA